MKCGIVGLPNVGKSTLFNCLSNAKAQAANFPFCTIDANVGVVTVPDERLYKLQELVNPYKVVPATVEIVDIAGLVKGASKGEGLGNKFLANIRETHAIIHVLRCFDNNNITHVEGSVNPIRDKEIIDTELQLKDLETVEARIHKIERQAKSGDKELKKNLDFLVKYKNHLEEGKNIRTLSIEDGESSFVKDLQLLTSKPIFYLCNIDEKSLINSNKYLEEVVSFAKDEGVEVLSIAAAVEADIAELESYKERKLFLDDYGLSEPGVNKVIKAAYDLLNYQTFFTAGEKEVKAWTITKGFTAPQAAGIIHTDFQRGFIKAEVISYNDYVSFKSEHACREAGKLLIEGKEYVVCDGDVMHFKFNV